MFGQLKFNCLDSLGVLKSEYPDIFAVEYRLNIVR